jgi:hypothetical protein
VLAFAVLASLLLGSEPTASDVRFWPVAVAECLLALDHEPTRLGGRRSALGGAFAHIERHSLVLATDCGGGEPSRARCRSECLGLYLLEGSFLGHHEHLIALAGIVAPPDRNELWILEHHGAGYRKLSSISIPEGQPVLVPAVQAKRFADVQAHIDGNPLQEPQLLGEERVPFCVLIWRAVDDGWEGSLYAVVLDTRTAALRLHYLLSMQR